MEDQVLHAAAAQGLGTLLAERPANRLGDIALAAAVRADDPGDAGQNSHSRLLGKRLEPVQDDRL